MVPESLTHRAWQAYSLRPPISHLGKRINPGGPHMPLSSFGGAPLAQGLPKVIRDLEEPSTRGQNCCGIPSSGTLSCFSQLLSGGKPSCIYRGRKAVIRTIH